MTNSCDRSTDSFLLFGFGFGSGHFFGIPNFSINIILIQ